MSIATLNHFIDGASVPPGGGEYMSVENPATCETIARVACGTAADVDRAVAAAQRAFENPAWRNMLPADRAALLERLGQIVMQNVHELVYLEVISSGGTVSRVSSLDLLLLVDYVGVLADIVRRYPFTTNLSAKPLPEATDVQVVKEAMGVCGLIPAWNVPMMLFVAKLLPALAAGNTVVVKPSELTPHTTVRLAQLFAEVLPAGVLNVVNGVGSVVGEALTLHPGIAKISFTGSTAIGKRVLQNAAATMKRVTLELGGKGAGIVTPDADLEAVAHGALFAVMMNSGQACESGTRLLVHESIYEPLLSRMAELAETLRVGNPLDPNTSMGPMCTAAHGQKVLGHVRSALEEGARVVCGGGRVNVPGCEGGFFVAPTLLADCHNEMKAVREEIFGPVLAVIKYRTEEEAIRIANDTVYGLSAGVWTGDLVAGQRIARQLRAGSVWINDWHAFRADVPFGGYKQSGIGREFGVASIEAFLETKAITTAFQRDPAKKRMTYGSLFKSA